MTKKSRGVRHKTRDKLSQKAGFRPRITKFIEEFDEGQMVMVVLEPSSYRGMPHPRFKGKVGHILEKRGKSYIIQIQDGNKTKKLISSPEHIKAI